MSWLIGEGLLPELPDLATDQLSTYVPVLELQYEIHRVGFARAHIGDNTDGACLATQAAFGQRDFDVSKVDPEIVQ